MNLSTRVTISTCGGEFEGKVVGFIHRSNETLYKISGPEIISTTSIRSIKVINGQKNPLFDTNPEACSDCFHQVECSQYQSRVSP